MRKSHKISNKPINAAFFTEALSDVAKSQADLARHLDLSPSQISKLLKGGRRVQLDEVEKLALFLGKSNAEVLSNLGVKLDGGGSGGPARGATIPVVGHLEADGTAEIDVQHPSRTVDAPGLVPPGTVAITANGAAHTAATLVVGGMFFVQMVDRLEAAAIGRLSLVRLNKGPWLLRTVKPAAEVGSMTWLARPASCKANPSLLGLPSS